MIKKTIVLLSCLLLFPFLSYSQQTKIHPIDKALEACIEKDSTTAGMTNCAAKAYEMWDKELNKVYAELSRKLNAEGKQTLKAAQVEWLKYRDAEFRLIESIYSRLEGTMYIPMRKGDRMEIVKKRAIKLKEYLDLLKND